ncbi:MAG TPA: hypothetical protein VJZ00_05180 [Thermoanaerobaculia bacterium]|nr:hypothetical protein [Thermoanaerobaculia bacterium]
MHDRRTRDKRCTYVVVIDQANRTTAQLRDLSQYLSTLGVAGCDVVILDNAPHLQFELSARILRWVGRHIAVRGEEVVRAAATFAACEKVIVAAEDVRYTPEAIGQICDLLEVHEVVEPQDYLEPLPWWGGIEAGRILVHRAIDGQPDHGATFGFRRAAIRTVLRGAHAPDPQDDPVRQLAGAGAEVFPAGSVFVRRQPGAFDDWLDRQPRIASRDFVLPVKTAFFFALLPLLLLLGVLGGLQIATGYAGLIAFATIALAMRGRVGATTFFPLHACFFAPLWVFERSLSVYWALFRKLRGTDTVVANEHVPTPGFTSTSARHG